MIASARLRILGLALAAVAIAAGPAVAQTLYWVETNFAAPLYRSAAPDGSGATAIPLGVSSLPEGIAFDEAHRHVYWTEASWSGARVLRANVDGSDVFQVVRGGSAFRGIALDVAAGKVYFTSSYQPEGGKIRRVGFDGADAEVVLDLGPDSNPRGIALDPAGGKMYWTDVALNAIRRANLDGTGVETLASPTAPYGIAVDAAGGFVYFTQPSLGSLSRVPLAGGSTSKLKGSLDYPTYLALDPATATMYWIDGGTAAPRLRSGPMATGGSIVDLATVSSYGGVAFSPVGIVAAPAPGPVTAFALGATTPNPAAGPSRVGFALPRASRVRLEVIDPRGRRVATLIDGDLAAGRHEAAWSGRGDAGPVAPGIYFVRLVAPGTEIVRRTVRL